MWTIQWWKERASNLERRRGILTFPMRNYMRLFGFSQSIPSRLLSLLKTHDCVVWCGRARNEVVSDCLQQDQDLWFTNMEGARNETIQHWSFWRGKTLLLGSASKLLLQGFQHWTIFGWAPGPLVFGRSQRRYERAEPVFGALLLLRVLPKWMLSDEDEACCCLKISPCSVCLKILTAPGLVSNPFKMVKESALWFHWYWYPLVI